MDWKFKNSLMNPVISAFIVQKELSDDPIIPSAHVLYFI